MDFEAVTSSRFHMSKEVFPEAKEIPSKLQVLKLHGSMNWYTLSRSKERMPSRLPATKKVRCSRRIAISAARTAITRGAKRARTNYTWPIIVPPVYEKGAFLAVALEPVWAAAGQALAQADRIIVYGYSFPEADHHSRSFIRRATAHMPRRPVVVCLNPQVEAAVRAHQALRPGEMFIASNVARYVRGRLAAK